MKVILPILPVSRVRPDRMSMKSAFAERTCVSLAAQQNVHEGCFANLIWVLFAARQDVHEGCFAKLTWVSFAARQDVHK